MKLSDGLFPFRGQRVGLRIIIYYLLLGAFWAFCSDPLMVVLVSDSELRELLHPLRDILFFLFTGAFLYLLLGQYLTALRKGDEHLRQAAYHDSLTGLANQRAFQEALEEQVGKASLQNRLAILFLDLDRFRSITRTLGHETGNRLLQEIASRLKSCLCEGALLSRFGGDEFAILIPQVENSEMAAQAAKAILRCLKEPFPFVEHGLHLSGSLGIAVGPHDGQDASTLLKNADVARNRAKEMGGNGFQFYYPAMNELFLQSLLMENRLHSALEKNELNLRYQPLQSLHDGTIKGVEALVCWKFPGGETVSPERFIPLAEETGLIEPIGEWVLETACNQNMLWQKQGLPPQRIAVNVSVRQFYRDDFLEIVTRVLRRTGLDSRWLALEVTESVLMQDVEQTRNILVRLKELGVTVVIDDFGTGYSSLSYLKRFPVDTLKIDQSFVEGIPRNTEDSALTGAIIAMGHALGLEVVAEGVERLEQRDFLQQRGCDRIQGFLFHPPLTAKECGGLLLERQLETSLSG